jgi:hypothetical protein
MARGRGEPSRFRWSIAAGGGVFQFLHRGIDSLLHARSDDC